MSNLRAPFVTLAMSSLFVMAAIACSSSGDSTAPAPLGGEIVSPVSGDHVHATLASASLGDETCVRIETASIRPLSCAAIPDGGAKGTGLCGGPCRATTIVLDLKADPGSGAAHVAITGVSLMAANGALLATLTSSTPESWDSASGTYHTWDQTVGAGSSVSARYTISPPPWSTLGSSSNGTQYRLQITVDVDGAKLDLSSTPMTHDTSVVST